MESGDGRHGGQGEQEALSVGGGFPDRPAEREQPERDQRRGQGHPGYQVVAGDQGERHERHRQRERPSPFGSVHSGDREQREHREQHVDEGFDEPEVVELPRRSGDVVYEEDLGRSVVVCEDERGEGDPAHARQRDAADAATHGPHPRQPSGGGQVKAGEVVSGDAEQQMGPSGDVEQRRVRAHDEHDRDRAEGGTGVQTGSLRGWSRSGRRSRMGVVCQSAGRWPSACSSRMETST